MQDKRVMRNVYINAIALLAGFICTLLAGFVTNTPVQLFLGGLGGAVLGTSLSGFLSLLKTLDLTELIIETVQTLKRNTGTDEDLLANKYRKKFYHYHATVVTGERLWVLAIFDFSKFYAPNSIKCATSFISGTRGPMDYALHGTIVGRSLMISDYIDLGPRCTHIGFFPFFGEQYTDVAHGFLFHENWDNQYEVAPCLITQHPLENVSSPGPIDKSISKRLDIRWAHSVGSGTPFNFGIPVPFDLHSLVRPPPRDIHSQLAAPEQDEASAA
jgi:hypothetical protein